MISRGSWRLSRKCANGKRRRLLARSPARPAPRPPQTPGAHTKSRRAPRRGPAAGPGVGAAGGARAGSPARGGGRGRCPGALAPVAHLARWRRRRQPGGGGAPRGRAVERRAGPAAALGSREGGSGPAPEAISFCASHMKAASRAPGPRCRRRRGERELHCAGTERAAAVPVSSPRAPGGAAPAPAPLPAPGLPPASLPGWLARSLPASQARRPRVCGVCRARAV